MAQDLAHGEKAHSAIHELARKTVPRCIVRPEIERPYVCLVLYRLPYLPDYRSRVRLSCSLIDENKSLRMISSHPFCEKIKHLRMNRGYKRLCFPALSPLQVDVPRERGRYRYSSSFKVHVVVLESPGFIWPAASPFLTLPSNSPVNTPYRLTSSVVSVTPFFIGAPPLGAPRYRQGWHNCVAAIAFEKKC